MKTKLRQIWESLRASFWFIPLIIIMVAIVLSFGLVWLDLTLNIDPDGLFGYFFGGGVDSARSILSTIAGAMLGVAGTVFSITLVALTLASTQFGPRLLRNFMLDRINQIVLGTYVATFVYCLIVLRSVQMQGDIHFVPNISVMVAILVAVANIFLLIVFIHHISISIHADRVISEVGQNLNASIDKLFPKDVGLGEDMNNKADFDHLIEALSHTFIVKNDRSGYLQLIDNNKLIKIGVNSDALITHHFRPGDFMVKGTELVQVYSEVECSEDIQDGIRDAFILGSNRSPIQDPEFALHQMVEIAARALSPGINDPYTAINCIDILTSTMCHLTSTHFPKGYFRDVEGKLRVASKAVTFDGMMDAAFNQIRQYGREMPAILIRLMESFVTIHSMARTEEQANAVQRHAGMVLSAGKSHLGESNDLEDLRNRFERMG